MINLRFFVSLKANCFRSTLQKPQPMSNRRDFLKNTALSGTGLLLASPLAAYTGSPNETIKIGVMGVKSRGDFLAKKFATLPNVKVAYLCDPDEQVLNKCKDELTKQTGTSPQGFSDIRKMLELKDLDALVIAAPDHWHAPAAIMGLQAGKHVYVEKPCSHNPREGELLVAASNKHQGLIQMGNQRRNYTNVQEMIKQLHKGVIGRPYFARAWYVNARKSIGKGNVVSPPAHLNFDLWQGPAPRRNYQDNLVHYNWHWFWHWGTGEALNNGTHELDVVRWGLGVDYPNQVVSSGGRFHFQDDWETPDTQTISFKFPNNTGCTWEGRSCNSFETEGGGRGVIFYGDQGTLVYPGGNSFKVYDLGNKLIAEVKDTTPFDPSNPVSPMEKQDTLHLVNFCESIRGKEKLQSPILEGHKSTLLPQLGNIAYRTGRALNIDPNNGRILNDKDAMKLWGRTYEKGWEPLV
jgi:predicted dehydrogenase